MTEFFGENMKRIEKLRKRALEFDFCKDEFYYLFYKNYEKNCDADEHSRYAEALSLKNVPPFFRQALSILIFSQRYPL